MQKPRRGAIPLMTGLILIRGFAGGGISITSSLFFAPVARELGVGIGELSLYYSIMSLVAVFWLPLAGKLMTKVDVRLLAGASALLQGLSFAAFGLQNHVMGFYLLAIPHAIGTGFLVNLLGPILINRYFPRNGGLMLGLQMAFVGIFGVVFQPLTSYLIENTGWRSAYGIVGLVSTAAVIWAAFLLGKRPQTEGISPATETQSRELSEKEAVRLPSFYFLLICMTALTGATVFIQHVPTYGEVLGLPLGQIGVAMGVSSLGSALGAVGIGLINDKIGPMKTTFAILSLWVLGVVSFFFGENLALFSVGSFLTGVAISSISILVPFLTRLFYGSGDYARIFSKISLGAPLASILLIPGYGYIYDLTGSYFWVLILLLALLAAAILSVSWGWQSRKKGR